MSLINYKTDKISKETAKGKLSNITIKIFLKLKKKQKSFK